MAGTRFETFLPSLWCPTKLANGYSLGDRTVALQMPDKHVVEEHMPTYVDPDACNACAGIHQGPLCVYICPNDLMILRSDISKGFNQEPEMCSECYACVKLCPQEAIHVRGYADFVPLGAMVQPRRVEQGLQWTVRFRDGRELQ